MCFRCSVWRAASARQLGGSPWSKEQELRPMRTMRRVVSALTIVAADIRRNAPWKHSSVVTRENWWSRSGPNRNAPTGEVLIRIRRVGICGTDYHIYEGSHPYLQYPRVMGHELAAEVVEAPRRQPLQARTNWSSSIPTLPAAPATPAARARPNCCMNIAVLGVHRDGGMTRLISVPETQSLSGRRSDRRPGGDDRVSRHRRAWRQPRRRLGQVRRARWSSAPGRSASARRSSPRSPARPSPLMDIDGERLSRSRGS